MSGDAQKQKWIFLLSMALVFVGSSCVSHRDLISLNGADFYFSPKEAMPDSMAQVVPTPAFQPYKIRTHDQLLIQVNSFEGSTGDFINQNQGNQSGANRFQYDPPTVYFNSYSVSDSGFIKTSYSGRSTRGRADDHGNPKLTRRKIKALLASGGHERKAG